jgi:hypothetical protein
MVAWYIVSTLSKIPYIFISKVIPINILKSPGGRRLSERESQLKQEDQHLLN